MIAGYRQFNDLLDEAYGSESQEDIMKFYGIRNVFSISKKILYR